MSPRGKLDAIDGLRGLAVLSVVAFHQRLCWDRLPTPTLVHRLLAPSRFGYVGVHLFLVLSGFCLTHSLLRRHREGRPPTLRRYLLDRWRRIAPPYYIAMFLCIILACITDGPAGWPGGRQLAYHLAFLHGLRPDTLGAINAPFWSLSIEFQFYLWLPLLFAASLRFGVLPTLAGVLAMSLAWRIYVLGVLPGDQWLLMGTFAGRWAEFAAGMAIAWWHDRRLASGPSWPTTAAAVGSALCFALGVDLSRRGFAVVVGLDYLFGAAAALLVVAALRSSTYGGKLSRALSTRPLAWVGAISYSVYLTHDPILNLARDLYFRLRPGRTSLGDAVELTVAAAAVLLAGWTFHVVVERRFLRSVDAGRPRPAAVVRPTQLSAVAEAALIPLESA